MKVAYLIGQYLLQNRQMELQGLGEFVLDSSVSPELEKGKIRIPENAIHFTHNRKAIQDPGLIAFVSEHSGKIKSLAFSDLEDYLNIGKQLLNVSKQFNIEGLGTIIMNDDGTLSFMQGYVVSSAIDDSKKPVAIREETQNTDINFEENLALSNPPSATPKKVLSIIALLIGVAVLAWAGYYVYSELGKSAPAAEVEENIRPVVLSTPAEDSLRRLQIADSIAAAEKAANPSYKVIIETAKQPRANKRYDDLIKMGYDVNIEPAADSATFKIYTVIYGALADSSKSRDSITRFFGRKARVEPN